VIGSGPSSSLPSQVLIARRRGTDTGNGATTDADPQQLAQQDLDLADAQALIGAQHPHKRAEPRDTAIRLHLRRQLATGGGTTARADQAVLSDV
jgi:hypothetical protein